MRTFINGGAAPPGSPYSNSTADAAAYLATTRQLYPADLYVINTGPSYAGQYLGKQFLLTDWGARLMWSYRGVFSPATISRGGVESKIGLEADTLDITWSPKDSDILADDGGSPATTLLTVMQGFRYGIFDDGLVEVWRAPMQTPGDCDTLGACLMFAGRIGDVTPDRLNIKLSIVSRMECLNQQVPTNLIEPTNIGAQYSVGMIPVGASSIYSVVAGSQVSKIYADVSPTMAAGTYDSGYLTFKSGKLAGMYRRIRQQTVESGHHAFYLDEPLPFLPATSDALSPYIPVPIDFAGAVAAGTEIAAFPYVPQAITSSVVIA